MTHKRVLITGATGILGKALIDTRPEGLDIYLTFLRELPHALSQYSTARLDVGSEEQVAKVFEWADPEVVIHLAGMGNVDFAERNQSLAYAINVEGTQNVINACRRHASKLIFLSSNAVFCGECPPYNEDSSCRPVNYYGRLKVIAEDMVKRSGLDHVIMRAIMMYGWHYPQSRANPVTSWLDSLTEFRPIKVVSDRYSQPLLATDCALAIWETLNSGKCGIYHIAGPDRLSLYEFALCVAEIFELKKSLIEPVPSVYFPDLAPRPVDTSFLISKIKAELQFQPRGVREGLIFMRSIRKPVENICNGHRHLKSIKNGQGAKEA